MTYDGWDRDMERITAILRKSPAQLGLLSKNEAGKRIMAKLGSPTWLGLIAENRELREFIGLEMVKEMIGDARRNMRDAVHDLIHVYENNYRPELEDKVREATGRAAISMHNRTCRDDLKYGEEALKKLHGFEHRRMFPSDWPCPCMNPLARNGGELLPDRFKQQKGTVREITARSRASGKAIA